jgi:hypothetical protein
MQNSINSSDIPQLLETFKKSFFEKLKINKQLPFMGRSNEKLDSIL